MTAWWKSWRVSLRLARREARRHKGRSVMVAALIGAPVIALAFVAVTYKTFSLTPEEQVTRQMGVADALVNWSGDVPVDQLGSDANAVSQQPPSGPAKPKNDQTLLSLLPSGSTVSRLDNSGTQLRMRTPSGIAGVQARYVDLGDPLTRGLATILSGRAPAKDGEVALSPQAADRLGASVGGSVRTLDGDRTLGVVGLVEFPDDLREMILFHPAALTRTDDGGGTWLAGIPGGVTPDLIKQLNQAGVWVDPRVELPGMPVDGGPGGSEELTLSTIVVGMIVFEVILLCAPAFAVGARRRRRELALVAANGGTPKQLRRIMLADGVVLGVVGALPGLLLGVLLAALARPFLEEYLGARGGAFRVFPLALAGGLVLAVVTGLLAALVPAVTTARQDVVTALSGRRGIVRSRRRWIFAGLAVMVAGAAASGGATLLADSQLLLVGLVLAQLGFVVVTPSLVGLLGRIGRALPLAPRIAMRDASRNRAAAAPAISAVMAVVTGSVMLGIYMNSETVRNDVYARPMLPDGYASVRLMDLSPTGGPQPMDAATTARLDRRVRDILPVRETSVVDGLSCPASDDKSDKYCALELALPDREKCPFESAPTEPEQQAQARADQRCHEGAMWGAAFGVVADDGSHLRLITDATPDDVAKATAALRSGAVVVTDPRYVVDGKVQVVPIIGDSKGDQRGTPVTVPAYVLRSGVHGFDIVAAPDTLTRLGLGTQPAYLVAATTRTPTSAEEEQLNSALLEFSQLAYATVERAGHDRLNILLIVLALASALVTLAAAAIATGLAAADGRADLATLGAIGASPRVRRFMSLSQSGVIAGVGTLLGLVVGIGGALALIAGVNRSQSLRVWPIPADMPMVVPWLQLGIAVVVPVVAMVGAGLLTRSRLPIERR
ncbi:MAG: FtsX-like permease family protein [Hamadaea sp.]|nr:FtsX-like permease family protein [Hamadaea sp.]NUR49827.1 FtsX-like permease family protein [Hamadaea sp.]